MENDIPLNKGLYRFIHGILSIFLFGLFQFIIRNPNNFHILKFALTHAIMEVDAHAFFLEFVVDFAQQVVGVDLFFFAFE